MLKVRHTRNFFAYIRNNISPSPCIVKQTDLLDKLIRYIQTDPMVTHIKASTRKHIGRKLAQEFGTSLHSVSDQEGKVLIYPDNLTRDMLDNENMALRKRLSEVERAKDGIETTYKIVGTKIQQDVKLVSQNQPCPSLPGMLEAYSSVVPSSL